MNNPSRQLRRQSRANKFEAFIAFVLLALGLMFLGAAFDFVYRLVLTGWRAADFLFNLFFANN